MNDPAHLFATIFDNFPQEWKILALPDAVDFQEGPGILAKDFHEDGVPLLRLKSIQNTYATLDGCNYLSEDKVAKKWNHFRLRLGDMLVSTSATIGIVSEVTQLTVGAIPYTGIIRMRPKTPGVAPGFIKYFMKSSFFIEQATAMAAGAVLSHFGPTHLRQMLFPLPPLPSQRKIAGVLSAYDDLIENNTRRIVILEEMAQAIYREWFVNFRFPGHEKVKLINSPLGKIPEGWNTSSLSQLVDTQYGYTESANAEPVGPKYLRGMDINKTSFIDWSTVPYCPIADEDRAKYSVKTGDMFVIRMADPGKVGIVEQDVDAVFASYLIRLTIRDSRLTPYYLFHFLLSDTYQGYITGASTGTTRKSASAGVVVGVDMLLPPVDLLRQFEEQVTPLRQLLTSLIKRNVVLRKTRDLLLPKLISGQLDVEELDIDTGEPLVEAP